jgi:transposase
MNELFLIPGCRIEQVTRAGPTTVQISTQGTRSGAACPNCRTLSQAVHSRYRRRPADLPNLGSAVCLDLLVRRFYCRNTTCARRTFAEPLPDLLAPRARRTRRLAATQGEIGVACGGEAGARLLRHLGMPTSPDSVLRLVRAIPLPACGAPRILGVDDWALRKGHTYGTILVDLEARRVVDLLPDRTAPTLAAWLREHDTVEVVARDRSTEYASGISLGAPQAIQVADRWHLLVNLREMIGRWLSGIHGRLRGLPPVPGVEMLPARRRGAYPRTRADAVRTAESRARRVAQYEEVRRRFGAGETLLAISRATGLARVRRFAYAESFPERAGRGPVASTLDPFLDHLEARVAAGCENAAALWREVKDLGFPGTAKQVRRWLSRRRSAPAPSGPRRDAAAQPEAASLQPPDATPTLPSPKHLAWLLGQSPEALRPPETATLAWIAQDAEVARVSALVPRLAELVRCCGIGRDEAPAEPLNVLKSWLDEAASCGIQALETFAAGLRQDEAAIRAALTMPWSSGQAEGQINKLKLIKRQMYGRAKFDLIRRRVLLAA